MIRISNNIDNKHLVLFLLVSEGIIYMESG